MGVNAGGRLGWSFTANACAVYRREGDSLRIAGPITCA